MDTEIAAFITARLNEYEANAWEYHNTQECDQTFSCRCGYEARVLRQVAALRAIVDQWWHSPDSVEALVLTFALSQIASIWADHPDYRQEWRPSTWGRGE